MIFFCGPFFNNPLWFLSLKCFLGCSVVLFIGFVFVINQRVLLYFVNVAQNLDMIFGEIKCNRIRMERFSYSNAIYWIVKDGEEPLTLLMV